MMTVAIHNGRQWSTAWLALLCLSASTDYCVHSLAQLLAHLPATSFALAQSSPWCKFCLMQSWSTAAATGVTQQLDSCGERGREIAANSAHRHQIRISHRPAVDILLEQHCCHSVVDFIIDWSHSERMSPMCARLGVNSASITLHSSGLLFPQVIVDAWERDTLNR